MIRIGICTTSHDVIHSGIRQLLYCNCKATVRDFDFIYLNLVETLNLLIQTLSDVKFSKSIFYLLPLNNFVSHSCVELLKSEKKVQK